jgi:hypothetical protein
MNKILSALIVLVVTSQGLVFAPAAPAAATQIVGQNPLDTLTKVLTKLKEHGTGRLPVPNIGRFVGGGSTMMDKTANPADLARKMMELKNGKYVEIKSGQKYWDAVINDLRGERVKDPTYMGLIAQLKTLKANAKA